MTTKSRTHLIEHEEVSHVQKTIKRQDKKNDNARRKMKANAKKLQRKQKSSHNVGRYKVFFMEHTS